ncbi:Pvc16 family protein [Amycolatopsis sp. RTGN1]|uniref:Pvc16 family protein n=1 Tax=Amycolatopsis ponsaeliensis TaxID=2992142 RepID=UPI002550B86C|nr:Pvc16 family protein [Amycolatopsis sp. RTGN1]
MSAGTAIGMVSSSLRNLLVGEMRLNPAPDVTILAPDEASTTRRVNLFLYRLAENQFLKNQDFTVKAGSPNQLVPAPLSVNLFYLLTSYAPNDPLEGNATAHQILGEAMRVFYENPVVPAIYLDPGLADAREHLQIAGDLLDPEELRGIWTTFSQPFRLSVMYQVSTVQLDRLPAAQRPLANRVRTVGVPEIRAPLDLPVVTGMTPAAGPAGTVVTFTGAHLAGWRGMVSVGNQTVLPSQPLSADSFTAAVPALSAGFYELRVDVAKLARRTFLFEVTP